MPFIHNDWISYKAKMQYRGATPPNPAKFFMCLADTNLLSRTSAKSEFFAAELKAQNGYQRAAIVFGSDGVYSNTNKRHEMPLVTATYSAVGGALQFQTVFLIADGSPNAPKSFAAADVNASSNVITIASHGLTSGDEIMVDAEAGSTLPSGLSAGTLYKAIGVSTDNFQISSDGATAIDIGAGSGTFRLRYANGKIHSFDVSTDSQLIQAGRTGDIYLTLAEANDTFGVGV
jgi:hypothetical protein